MPSSITAYQYANSTCSSITCILPSVGDISFRFGALQHANSIVCNFSVEQNQFKNVD